MEYCRYVLLVLKSEEKKSELLNQIPNWRYCDELEWFVQKAEYSFVLINEAENIEIYFRKIHDCVYKSINVLPYNTDGLFKIDEPQEKNMHNDILFKLCIEIKKKFENLEIECGIIPCKSDEI